MVSYYSSNFSQFIFHNLRHFSCQMGQSKLYQKTDKTNSIKILFCTRSFCSKLLRTVEILVLFHHLVYYWLLKMMALDGSVIHCPYITKRLSESIGNIWISSEYWRKRKARKVSLMSVKVSNICVFNSWSFLSAYNFLPKNKIWRADLRNFAIAQSHPTDLKTPVSEPVKIMPDKIIILFSLDKNLFAWYFERTPIFPTWALFRWILIKMTVIYRKSQFTIRFVE